MLAILGMMFVPLRLISGGTRGAGPYRWRARICGMEAAISDAGTT